MPPIDVERQRQARDYARRRRWLFAADLALGAAVLAVLLLGISAALERALLVAVPAGPELVAVYFLVIWGSYTILAFPLEVVGGLVLPRQNGLSVQSFPHWLGDWAKSTALSAAFALAMVEVVYYLLAAYPGVWWLITGGVALLFSVVFTYVSPVMLLPLFYRLTPLEDRELASRLATMAERAGAKVQGVYRIDLSTRTTAANAAVIGLGATRRVVLGDTLLARYTPDEIAAVFAHELGHHVHGDLPKLVAVSSALTLAGLGLADLFLRFGVAALGLGSMAEVATMPLLALALGVAAVVTMPLSNAYSRRVEAAADRYAVQATGDVGAFVSAMERLANQNLADVEPARWVEVFYSHPPIGRRIAAAKREAGGR